MTPTRTLGCAVAALAAAIGFAGPAHADPPLLNGIYQGADGQFAWTIATECAVSGCSGTVSSNQGWASPMTLTDGHWNFHVAKPDGAVCNDGSFAPVVIRVSIDPESLAGVVTHGSDGACSGEDAAPRPFQLKRIG